MASLLHYGNRPALELDLPPSRLVAEFVAPAGPVVRDPAAAVAAALANPIRFPPLARAIVPGDRVALALDAGVSRHAAIVAGVVGALLDCGTPPEAIAVVEPAPDEGLPGPDPRRGLPARIAARVRRVVHDPTDRQQLCYLAASASGRAIYVNRTIYDAGLVLPISYLRPRRSLGLNGRHAGLFPAFSDSQTIARFRVPDNVELATRRRRRQTEVDEVAWLLGVALTIRLVPAGDGQLLSILAGDGQSVFEQGQRLCDAAWTFAVPRRASLVIASVGRDRRDQTWTNVARALAASRRAVVDQGAIVVCADLQTSPGPALRRVGETEDLDAALRALRRDRSPHAGAAVQLIHAALRGRVYLLCGLDADVVEQIGMAPIAGGDEIGRLARQHETCIVLRNAQHAVPMVLDERAPGRAAQAT